MRVKLLVAAAACIVVAVGAVVAYAVISDDESDAAPATGTTGTGSRSVTIRVLATVTKAQPVDLPPRNVVNEGDRILVQSQLKNAVPQFGRPKGSIIGVDYSTITYVSQTERLVNVQITLPGGGLHLRGSIPVEGGVEGGAAAVIEIPVVGGTRDFAGATGVSEARSAEGSQTLNIYRLRLPG